MTSSFTESVVEEAALEWLQGLGYTVLHGPEIAYDAPAAERADPNYGDVLMARRLKQSLIRLNPDLSAGAIDDALRKINHLDAPSLVTSNHVFHRMLVDGINVEYTRPDGSIAGGQAKLLDFAIPDNNDWVAVNQFTVIDGQPNRRPDIIIFVNGFPLAVVELKNPVDEDATIWSAFKQLQTYKAQIPALFNYNVVLAISDGMEARIGSLSADEERFMPWRTIAGEELAPASLPQLQVALQGLFEKRRLLDFIRFFVVFEDEGGGVLTKKIAGYHQFHAVNRAVESTIAATREDGDKRAGVVWAHTRQRQESDHGFLCGAAGVAPATAESHDRGHHRPQ